MGSENTTFPDEHQQRVEDVPPFNNCRLIFRLSHSFEGGVTTIAPNPHVEHLVAVGR